MKRKILIIGNVTSGLVSFRLELVQRLAEEHEVTVMASDDGRVEQITRTGCRFINTDFDRHGTNPIKELQLISVYKRLIKQVGPDIVFTYTIKPNVYAGMVCQLLHIPYAANITGLGTALENPGPMQKISSGLYKLGLRKAQKVFFQNTANRDFMLSRGIVKQNYDMLPGSGVNLTKFRVLPYPQSDTLEFTFISRIMKEKGIDQYLEAAEYLRNKYPFTRFHVCGDCEQDYNERLRKLSSEGIIIYHGRIEDISAMHAVSACTVHPSYYPEGMSNVLLESCACGRPVITTGRPGCGEIVDDGVNGYIVRERDTQDLIEKLERFIKLPAEEKIKMGLAGRKKAESTFDREIIIEKYLKEIQNLK